VRGSFPWAFKNEIIVMWIGAMPRQDIRSLLIEQNKNGQERSRAKSSALHIVLVWLAKAYFWMASDRRAT